MDAEQNMDRLARKGLAEDLNDDEIFELLTDHGVALDKAKGILREVKDNLSTSNQTAREALGDQTPDPTSTSNQSSDPDETFEEAFAEEVDTDTLDASSQGEETPSNQVNPSEDNEGNNAVGAFDEFEEDIEHDHETGDQGIFSRLSSLFSSSDDSPKSTEEPPVSAQPSGLESLEEKHTTAEEPTDPEYDAEALKQLAGEALDKGLAEKEILNLFIDHGVPESYTKNLLDKAKQEHQDEETAQKDDEVQARESEAGKQAKVRELSKETSDTDVTNNGTSEVDESNEEQANQTIKERGLDGDKKPEGSNNQHDTDNRKHARKENHGQAKSRKTQSARVDEPTSESNVSANELDEETLQAMAQHGMAKGFDRDDLIDFFEEHGVDKKRADNVINAVMPSTHKDTQGRDQSEHEGHTGTSEAKDAVAVQKQEQVTTAKNEEESFMSDMDKSQESLKVGRIYLTGRKPSYGRMQVRGLQDITGDEFESGGRTGFIDLSDTDEHIGGDDESVAEDSQQVGKERIRDEA